MNEFRILFLGDVVGPESVEYVSTRLSKYIASEHIDFTVVNAENCARGNGVDKAGAERLISCGADVLTTGNHVFKRYETEKMLDEMTVLLRPLNFPPETAGAGYSIQNIRGISVMTVSLLGIVGLEPLACPFRSIDALLSKHSGEYDISVVDFHAEATGEKAAFAHYLDGRVTAVIGTHTHVQTADARVMPGGTAFITDAGMCGPTESALGVNPDCVIKRLMTHLPVRFELSENPIKAQGVVVTADLSSGKAVSILPVAF